MSHKNNNYKSAYETVRVPSGISNDVIDGLRKLGVLEVMSNSRIRFTEQFKQQLNANDADLELFLDIGTAMSKHLQALNHHLYNDDEFIEVIRDIYNLWLLIQATNTFRSYNLIDTLKADPSPKPDKLFKNS